MTTNKINLYIMFCVYCVTKKGLFQYTFLDKKRSSLNRKSRFCRSKGGTDEKRVSNETIFGQIWAELAKRYSRKYLNTIT